MSNRIIKKRQDAGTWRGYAWAKNTTASSTASGSRSSATRSSGTSSHGLSMEGTRTSRTGATATACAKPRSRGAREWRRLPDGKTTQSLALYLRSWKSIYEVIERNFGLRLGGFDPGFLFFYTDGKNIRGSIDIPMWMARKMLDVALRAEEGDRLAEEAAGASL